MPQPEIGICRSDTPDPLVTLTGITKRFQGVEALKAVDFELRAGEVHVLFGENGAGKSTLINIIAGSFRQDEGTYRFGGASLARLSPGQARRVGIRAVFQEFSLAPNLTVVENILLGREERTAGFLRHAAMARTAARLIGDLGFDLNPGAVVGGLSRAHQQMVEIAKAMLDRPKVLILDEPTASLTEQEAETLFGLVAELKAQGVGIVYVSHRMREIRMLADRITVLRDGQLVRTVEASAVTDDELIELMTGRKAEGLFPELRHSPGAATIEVRGLTSEDESLQDVDFVAHEGEITGIAGLVGCGKSELIRAIYGLQGFSEGDVRIRGESLRETDPRNSLGRGIVYFPANRGSEGLAATRPIRENASMSSLDVRAFVRAGFIAEPREREAVRRATQRLKLRPPEIERPVVKLSGGNRQKVMLARGLMRPLSIFLFDEPTVGIDVGAKREVYEFMKSLLQEGATIVLVSSELPEVLALSNRLYVMHHGRVVDELEGEAKSEQNVLSAFFRADRKRTRDEAQ